LIVAGPAIAERLAASFGLGAAFEWSWKILQWPVAFALVSTALGLVYYFAPDAEQDWVWITPGAVVATALWVIVSLAFKFYVANFADYNAMYGAVGGIIVLLLWFYISGLAILAGAELNAEIEHASPYGKEPAEKVPGPKKKIGVAAARAYRERLEQTGAAPAPPITQPVAQGSRGQMAMESPREERTLGEMFAELSRDTRTLLQQEITLAKTELKEKTAALGKSAGLVAAGGFIAYGGLLAIVAAVVLTLIEMGLPAWAGALVGGIVIAAIGYFLVRSGLSRLSTQELKPRETIETLKEDAQWLRTQAK
jgi:hypothetical protein